MSERGRQIQVGLVFLLAVAVLVAGVLWFKNVRVGQRTLEMRVEFQTTSGLLKGDPVEVRGVAAGDVRDIEYADGRAVVVLAIQKGIELREGTRIVIENVGIMGQKLVAIYPAEQGRVLAIEDVALDGTYQPGIPELMTQLGSSLETFQRLGERAEQLLDSFSGEDGASFRRTIDNLETVSEELAVFLRGSRREIHSAIRNFDAAMADLHASLDGREEDIGRLLDNTARAAAQMETTLVTLEQSAEAFRRISERAAAGEGTLGQVLQDEQLYNELVATLGETRKLVADIQANPKKYVKLSLF